jgi:hypothetical protein
MPPKKITIKTGVGSTPNILVMLNKAKITETTKTETETKSDSVVTKSDVITSTSSIKVDLTHEDPIIQKYYNSLTPSEKIAHTIAKEKLGTSYDVTRTHGFLRWQKAQK